MIGCDVGEEEQDARLSALIDSQHGSDKRMAAKDDAPIRVESGAMRRSHRRGGGHRAPYQAWGPRFIAHSVKRRNQTSSSPTSSAVSQPWISSAATCRNRLAST